MTPGMKSKASLVTFIFVLFGVVLLSTYMVWPFLLAVIMGGILAVLASPLYRWLTARRLGPRTASMLTVLAVTFAVIGPATWFFIIATKQGIAAARMLADSNLSFDLLFNTIRRWSPVAAVFPEPAELQQQLRTIIESAARAGSAFILNTLQNIPNFLLQLALALISMFFFLIDGVRFVNWTLQKILIDTDVREAVKETFIDTSASVVWATLAASSAQAFTVFIAFAVLSVPSSFLAGGLTFILTWIPMVGSFPVIAAGCLYLYTQGAITKLIIMVGFGFLTGVIDNFVRPLVLKGRSDMHPLVSLVAIFGGITLFGMMGVFVGPILIAVLISLLQVWPLVANRMGISIEPSSEIVTPTSGTIVPEGERVDPAAVAELKRKV